MVNVRFATIAQESTGYAAVVLVVGNVLDSRNLISQYRLTLVKLGRCRVTRTKVLWWRVNCWGCLCYIKYEIVKHYVGMLICRLRSHMMCKDLSHTLSGSGGYIKEP